MPDSQKSLKELVADLHSRFFSGSGMDLMTIAEPRHRTPARPVVLDVDTGRDDAWAILGALDEFRVRGIVAGYGNISQSQAVRNALDVVDLGRRGLYDGRYEQPDIKIWQAETAPRVPTAVGLKEIERRSHINGNGLCNIILPASPEQAETPSVNWADAFAADCQGNPEQIDYLACGPMSNLSMLIDAFERLEGDKQAIKKYIPRVIAMGGCIDPALPVDFNFKADPASAQKVIELYGTDMVLVPFDESRKLRLTGKDIEALRPQSLAGIFNRDLMRAQCRNWSSDGTIMLHDPATLLVIGEKTPTKTERVSVRLDGKDAGRLVLDDKGTEVRRLALPQEVGYWRDKLLIKYLDLVPQNQPNA